MIKIENVTFRYENATEKSVENLSLHINEGEFILLMGSSGCGKTTVTRLINHLIPDFYQGELQGKITIDGKDMLDATLEDLSGTVGTVFQDPRSQFFATDTTAEIAFSCENNGMIQKEIIDRIKESAKKLGITNLLDKSIFKLSSGEKQLIAIASVYALSPKILVFDEPSANLDNSGIDKLQKLFVKLKKEGYTIIVSEHRIHYLTDVCDRAVHLEKGKIANIFRGEEFSQFTNERANQLGLRSVNLLELQGKDFENIEEKETVNFDEVSVSYNKEIPILKDVSFQAKKGDIIGVIGGNGAGKTTLISLLCGTKKQNSGNIMLNNKVLKAKQRMDKTFLVMQDSDYQLFCESVEKEMLLKIKEEGSVEKMNRLLNQIGLEGYNQRHPMTLSGGEKQRLCVAVSCMKDSDIICFDEPTSGLDYSNMKKMIELFKSLKKEGKTIFVVSHDYEFLMQVCTHFCHVKNGTVEKFSANSQEKVQDLYKILHERGEIPMHKKSYTKIILSYIEDCKGKMLCSCFFALLSVFGGILPYYGAFHIIVSLLTGVVEVNTYTFWTLICALGFVIKIFGNTISTTLSHEVAFTALEKMRKKVATKLLKAPLGVSQNMNAGKIKNIVVDEIENIEVPLAHVIPEGFSALVLPIAIFVYMCSINIGLALSSLITIPLAMIPYMIMFRGYNETYEKYMKSNEHMNNVVIEYIEGIEVVKTFNQSTTSYKKYFDAVNDFKELTLNWYKSTWKYTTLGGVLLPTTLLGVIPIGGLLYLNSMATIEQIIMTILLSMGMVSCLGKFAVFFNQLKSIAHSINIVEETFDITELETTEERAEINKSNIAFRNVSFAYQDGNAVLSNVNIEFPEHSFYAIVGPSGGGKSTLAKLIARFYDVTDGEITIDGTNIKDISLDQLSDLVSFVTQDNFLFNTSILENIRLGNPKASDEEVLIAAKKAQCDEFIMKLEKGYESEAGEAGNKLSGGEKQRIAIARMILKNAPIVILDEATAFTDPENEAQIQKAIAELTKDKTLIVIAHRLSTIKNADKILLVKNGEIEKRGTHEELLQTSDLYQSMWQSHIGIKQRSTLVKEEVTA